MIYNAGGPCISALHACRRYNVIACEVWLAVKSMLGLDENVASVEASIDYMYIGGHALRLDIFSFSHAVRPESEGGRAWPALTERHISTSPVTMEIWRSETVPSGSLLEMKHRT